MKTIFTLLCSVLMTVGVFAAGAKKSSVLSVRSADDRRISVVVDGKRFEPNDNSLMIQNVSPGYHSISIYKENRPGLLSVLTGRQVLLYNNSLAVKARTNVFVNIDRYGNVSVTEEKLRGNKQYTDWEEQDRFDYKSADRDHDPHEWNSLPDRDYVDYSKVMRERDFNQLLSSIQKEWLESNKLKSVSHIISTNYFTADQVKQLALLFSIENNRLSVAKQAYAQTIDQQHYNYVFNTLSFQSSKNELARFIRDGR